MPLEGNAAVLYDVNDAPVIEATGSAVPASAVYIGGSDGTNVQALATDTAGRQIAVGAAADGAAPVGNPVYIAGQDGTNLQALKLDTTGHPEVVGPGATGAAPVGNPVFAAGWDGTNVRALRTDATGYQEIVGPAADGAAAVGNPVKVAGKDGSGNVQTLLTDTAGKLQVATAPTTSSTATLTQVAQNAASTTILAANANRLGAMIQNRTTTRLFLAFAATASATAYTTRVPAGGYYEVPFSYTGIITGIWAAAGAGDAQVTELT